MSQSDHQEDDGELLVRDLVSGIRRVRVDMVEVGREEVFSGKDTVHPSSVLVEGNEERNLS